MPPTEEEKSPFDPTEEQLRNRELAASGEISSDLLTSTASVPFTQPKETSAFPIKDLELTQPEKQAQGLTEELQKLQEGLTGESAFRTQLEQEKGFAGLEKAQQDLTGQLRMLQAEAAAIPIQIQQEFQGRGVTAGGVAPIENERLRTNAIKALTVSSLLEASRGNLVLAQNQIDRAVAQKYNPIREKINTKINNLNLILQSPAYSLADKNRANRQLVIQQQQQREIAKQEDNTKIAQAMAAAAVKLHSGDQRALFNAQQVQALNPADPAYLQRVYQLVGQYQADPAEMQKDLDAHLIVQGNLSKLQQELVDAPFERQKLLAELRKLENDESLEPLRKEKLQADIAIAWANAAKITSQSNAAVKNGTPVTLNDGSNFATKGVLTAQQKELVSKTLIADKLVGQIEKLYYGAVSSEFEGLGAGFLSRLKGVTRTVGMITGTNQAFTSYINFVDSNLATIAKGLKGEVGALAEGDVKRARASFPTRFSSPQEAKTAFDALKQQIRDNLGIYGDISDTSQDTQVVNGKTYVKGSDGLYYEQ